MYPGVRNKKYIDVIGNCTSKIAKRRGCNKSKDKLMRSAYARRGLGLNLIHPLERNKWLNMAAASKCEGVVQWKVCGKKRCGNVVYETSLMDELELEF